jgi:uncharacterized protein DUF4062
MVSSTFSDLKPHRAALIKALEGQDLHPVAMEQDSALPDGTVVDASLAKVRSSAAYIVIVGQLYGQIPVTPLNPKRLSLTELEFREARRLDRPILVFIMGQNHPVRTVAAESDAEKKAKLEAFREEVKRCAEGSTLHRVYREFTDLHDFEVAATQAVAELRRHLDRSTVEALAPDATPEVPRPQAVRRTRRIALASAILVLASAALAAWHLWSSTTPHDSASTQTQISATTPITTPVVPTSIPTPTPTISHSPAPIPVPPPRPTSTTVPPNTTLPPPIPPTTVDGANCFATATHGDLELQAGKARVALGPIYTSSFCSNIHLKLTSATYRTYARACLETASGSSITSCGDWVFLSYSNTWDTLYRGAPGDSRWQLQMYGDAAESVTFFYTA